jgi:hypothetical protein
MLAEERQKIEKDLNFTHFLPVTQKKPKNERKMEIINEQKMRANKKTPFL